MDKNTTKNKYRFDACIDGARHSNTHKCRLKIEGNSIIAYDQSSQFTYTIIAIYPADRTVVEKIIE